MTLSQLLADLTEYQEQQATLYYKHKLNHKKHITGQTVASNVTKMRVTFPKQLNLGEEAFPLNAVIIQLNDDYKWTREQIADWLDTLDEQPVFYPEVEQSHIADEHRSHFIRNMPYGPTSTEIVFACGCNIPSIASLQIICGYCLAARNKYPFGYDKKGCCHDCRECSGNPDNNTSPQH